MVARELDAIRLYDDPTRLIPRAIHPAGVLVVSTGFLECYWTAATSWLPRSGTNCYSWVAIAVEVKRS